MAETNSHELERRREELAESLPALSRKRDETYRLNSNALALDRAGVTHRGPQEIGRLEEEEVAADHAIRDAQRELRNLDAKSTSESGDSIAAKVGRALRRGRVDR
jgi:hypothetical protein